ncbi:MAG: hypothetical protein NDF54_08845 [archaeon GB-1867-035]|nr:hypothetical protein [Candidatus Culexmicrobium profundum]
MIGMVSAYAYANTREHGLIVYRPLLPLTFIISFVNGLISGLEPFLRTIILSKALSPEEIAIKMTQLHVTLSAIYWLLLLTFILLLYFLYRPLNLKRKYKGILVTLTLASITGIFTGSFLGFILSNIFMGKKPYMLCIMLHSLSMTSKSIIYILAGFLQLQYHTLGIANN